MRWSRASSGCPRPDWRSLRVWRDFALWATACETALWPDGAFWSAYCDNRDEVVEDVIDADPVATAVRAIMATRTEWTGTASNLLGHLAEVVGERVVKCKPWPDSPRALAGRLREVATFLRKVGLEISFGREGRARSRIIRITAPDKAEADLLNSRQEIEKSKAQRRALRGTESIARTGVDFGKYYGKTLSNRTFGPGLVFISQPKLTLTYLH